MSQQNVIQKQIKDRLEKISQLSQLDLLTWLYGYRALDGKLLYFSVRERLLMQQNQDEKAKEWLEQVITEADEEYQRRAEDNSFKSKGEKRRRARRDELSLRQPPKGEKQTSRNPYSTLSEGFPVPDMDLGRNNSYNKLMASALQLGKQIEPYPFLWQAAAERLQTDSLNFGIANIAIPRATLQALGKSSIEEITQHIPAHPYWEVAGQLETKLQQYPKVVWQKISIERKSFDDDHIQRTVRRQRQAIRRALLDLVEHSQVKEIEGQSSTSYCLLRERNPFMFHSDEPNP